VTEVLPPQPLQAPALTPIQYASSVSADVHTAVESHFSKDVQLLTKNPQDFNAWMDVALLHKIGGDYHGAETIWIYVTKQWPTSSIAFHNLGDLYQNFLHDSVQAQTYYEQAALIDSRK
jgi:tetratricopeptide (TPR) repeat protein